MSGLDGERSRPGKPGHRRAGLRGRSPARPWLRSRRGPCSSLQGSPAARCAVNVAVAFRSRRGSWPQPPSSVVQLRPPLSRGRRCLHSSSLQNGGEGGSAGTRARRRPRRSALLGRVRGSLRLPSSAARAHPAAEGFLVTGPPFSVVEQIVKTHAWPLPLGEAEGRRRAPPRGVAPWAPTAVTLAVASGSRVLPM